MMRRIASALLCLCAAAANAAERVKPTAAPTISVPQRLVALELAQSQSWDILSHLTDRIGPRLSGSPQAAEAVRWTSEKLKSWGLAVRTEKVMVPRWIRGAEEAKLVSHLDQKIVLTALGMSVATPPEGLTAEVIAVSSYEELDRLGATVRGKIVLFNKVMDPSKVEERRGFEAYGEAVEFRGNGASRAARQGAVAALVRSVTTRSLRTPHTGSVRYDSTAPSIPAASVTTEDADLIQRLIERGDRVVMHLRLRPQTLPEVESANVIAEWRGSENTPELVLIGGHLDSWDLGTGAIDNGSGVAMVMETMRLLTTIGAHPRRTIRAVLFMNEENGLRGARGYAAQHRDEIPFHVAAIEADAGAGTPVGFVTNVPTETVQKLRPQLSVLDKTGVYRFEYSASTGADTSVLTKAGVPGFGLAPDPIDYFNYHHSAADTLDKIDPVALTRNTAALAGLAYTIADLPERLSPVPTPADEP